MIISSTSGHACEDTQHKYPYMYDGHLLRLKFSQNVYELLTQTDGHGTLQATKTSGLPGDSVTLNPIPNDKYTFSGYQSTGCTINGNTLTFGSQDCTAKATFYKEPELVKVATIPSALGKFSIGGSPRQDYHLEPDMSIIYPNYMSVAYTNSSTNPVEFNRIGTTTADYSNWKPSTSTPKIGLSFGGTYYEPSSTNNGKIMQLLSTTYRDNFYHNSTTSVSSDTFGDRVFTTACPGCFNLYNAVIEITAMGFLSAKGNNLAWMPSAYYNGELHKLYQASEKIVNVNSTGPEPIRDPIVLSGDTTFAWVVGYDTTNVGYISAYNGYWGGNLYVVQ